MGNRLNEDYRFFDSLQAAKLQGLTTSKRYRLAKRKNNLSRAVLGCINAGLLNDRGVDGLAQSLHISEQHLRRIVRSKTGTSPVRLNNERRLKTAKRLTIQTDLPITEVAFSAGFSSIRQFNNEFKKAFKTTPREMRKVASLLPLLRLWVALLWVLRPNR